MFNSSIPEDAALFDWVQKQDNATQYIKKLIREDMDKYNGKESLDESQFSILPYLRTTRPCQIPIQAGRYRYLTKEYKPGEDDSDQVIFHHPGHFLIYSRSTRQCIADATYAIDTEGVLDDLPDDEIVAVIFEIRTMPD